jgi:hypothetical protein
LAILFFAASCGVAQTPADPPGNHQKPKETKPANVDSRALLDALRNQNPAPAFVGGELPSPIFAKNFDWKEDARVWGALRKLIDHAEDAWHEMVAHLGDDRYCLTYNTVDVSSTRGYAINWTVGDACREIIDSALTDGYLECLRQMDKISYHRLAEPDFLHDKKKLKAWCEQRRSKSLNELQIEVCQWAVAELEKGDFGRVPTSRRLEWIAAVKAEIEALRACKRAFQFRGFEQSLTPYSRIEAEEFRRRHLNDKDGASHKM